MTILVVGKHIAITAKEEEIKAGVKHFYVMSHTAYFDPDNVFKALDPNGRRMKNKEAIDEYAELLAVANRAWDEKRMNMQAVSSATSGNSLTENLEKMLVNVLAEQSASAIFEATMPKVREQIIKEFGILPQVHEIKSAAGSHKITGVTHEKFDTVLNLINANIPVFLKGAAGTGKNVICKQVAESLGLDFYFTNAVTQEYKLTGFIDANGTYHETQFYKAFKDGGLFFLDEMDGSIPEVLIMLNAALANGYFDFPTGKVDANENFRVIAAGNTFGTGADMEYTGRYQLDAASLDRFALVEIDYSRKIENAIADGDTELVDFVEEFRRATNACGIKHLATYRCIERIHKLGDMLDLAEVLKIALLKNLQRDDIQIIAGAMDCSSNKYYKAMKS